MPLNRTLPLRRALVAAALMLIAAALPARTVDVADAAALQRALDDARPGDTILLADGTYTPAAPLTLKLGGRGDAKITIVAARRGGPVLAGPHGFIFESISHVVIDGLVFRTSTAGKGTTHERGAYVTPCAIQATDCSWFRLTRNHFALEEALTEAERSLYVNWVNFFDEGSRHNRVDHNLFENKFQSGVMLAFGNGSQFNRVDRNHFRDTASLREAGYEVEVTPLSMLGSYRQPPAMNVEQNIFENCDGDNETLEVKGNDIIIRDNTLIGCQGALSFRRANGTLITGNLFLNPKGKRYVGGVRANGRDNVIVNNFFEGLTGNSPGYSPMTIYGGDTEYALGLIGGRYFRTEDTVIAFNTFVDCAEPVFDIHSNPRSRPLAPRRVLIANNIISGTGDGVIRLAGDGDGIDWRNNLLYAEGANGIAAREIAGAGIRFEDPRLAGGENGIARPAGDSPAIRGARPPWIALPGQVAGERSGRNHDIGVNVAHAPLLRRGMPDSEVGPNAPEDSDAATIEKEMAAVEESPHAFVPSPNQRVQQFTLDGAFVRAWGSEGEADGQFGQILGLAVDPRTGDVIATDLENYRVQRFDRDGKFLLAFGGIGWERQPGKFYTVAGAAAAPDGTLYIADKLNNRVQAFAPDGSFKFAFGERGNGDGQFDYPNGIAVAPDGSVYVTETSNSRVQKFTADGAFVRGWGGYGQGDGQFFFPTGVVVAPDGSVYIADNLNNRVQKFSADGRFLLAWGGPGRGEGQFKSPAAVAVAPEGTVLVADCGNSRIQRFDPDGRYLGAFGIAGGREGEMISPSAIAVSPDGRITIAETHSLKQP